ncbi:MAG: polyprenyl synthetase family protein [Candidatus Bathyarchaeota archaeon]|jgi:octaprenyl-diphosphate synthase
MNRSLEIVSSNAFKTKISDYRHKIDDAIIFELHQHENSLFYEPLMKALKGGKRLRPILLLLSYECLVRLKEDPFPAAVAVELSHTESLIHDDIIDRDFLRRETVTFHASYGNEMALLSADFILSVILKLTARYKNPRVAQVLASATSEMCEGELEELIILKKRQKLGRDEYIKIISKKTASLFEASTAIGAIIAGAEEDEVKVLSDYGKLVGIAYQIQDDITDLGKTTSTDILKLLDMNSEKIRTLNRISNSFLSKAKEKLEKIKSNDAKILLLELADFILSDSITLI